MNKTERDNLINTVLAHEELRPLTRLERFLRKPARTLPYYILAALSHIKPFTKSFPTLWGTKMTCYLPEGNTFYYYGYCEANLTNFFLRYVEEGMSCIDVGAHVGIYTMLFSELTGSTGQVHSFEPTPWTYRLLQKNTEKLSNVHINNSAVAEGKRSLTFADYGPGYGAYNSAHASGAPALSAKPHMTEVESVSLDTYCAQHSIMPDVIKIDSEGFEFEVLQGMRALLADADTRPIISIEVANDEDWEENRNASFSLLQAHGYHPYSITTDGYITPHTTPTSYEYDNLLFVPEETTSTIAKLVR